jgi:predicted HTH domain antitoxin
MKISNIELSIVEKYILMLLYAHEGKCKGKLWFQKEMFKLAEVFKELKRLNFKSSSYGPYSETLEKYINKLEESGLIKDLSLTEKGYEIAKPLWENFKEREIIKANVDFLESLDEDELLLYIYVTSSETTKKSNFKKKILRILGMFAIKKRKVEDSILQRRKEIALKMLKEKKISLGLAAKLAGLSYFEMLDEAIKHGIKPFEVKGDI